MKKILIASLMICLLNASTAFAGDWFSWDKTNTEMHAPLIALLFIDYKQTIEIAKECAPRNTPRRDYNEINLYLGSCPTTSEVKDYFTAIPLAITALTYILPAKESHAFQGSIIGMEMLVIGANTYLGVVIRF